MIISSNIQTPTKTKTDVSSHNENWFDPKEIRDWILLEPDITDIDLRPYYYACKEKIDYFAGRVESSDISEIVDILLKSEMVVTQHIEKIKALNEIPNKIILFVSRKKLIIPIKIKAIPNERANLLFIIITSLSDYYILFYKKNKVSNKFT